MYRDIKRPKFLQVVYKSLNERTMQILASKHAEIDLKFLNQANSFLSMALHRKFTTS